jgi:hypothetical protein
MTRSREIGIKRHAPEGRTQIRNRRVFRGRFYFPEGCSVTLNSREKSIGPGAGSPRLTPVMLSPPWFCAPARHPKWLHIIGCHTSRIF